MYIKLALSPKGANNNSMQPSPSYTGEDSPRYTFTALLLKLWLQQLRARHFMSPYQNLTNSRGVVLA
jgi:hypothetical protein